MEIKFNVTGQNRKALVTAIGCVLNSPARYLGMPTAAYEVGPYNIDKIGTVTGPDNRDLIANLLSLHNIAAIAEEYDAPTAEIEDYPDVDQHNPGQYADPNEPPTEEMLKQAAAWTDPICPADLTPEIEHMTIEMPLTGFTPEKVDNLTKLVNAKATLLKAALGVDELPIIQTADTLHFPWFWPEATLTGDEVAAYTALISLLCKTAKKKTRVTAKEKAVEGSPKYAMRCFLLSLGMIGPEFRDSRRVLLSRLEGNSSWKNGKKAADSPAVAEPITNETGEATDDGI